MTTTEKQAPPECCPVCGAKIRYDWPPSAVMPSHQRSFTCDAGWGDDRPDQPWYRPCSDAMTAALRCIELLNRLRQWDMMSSADGPYWQAEIDKALRP